jgi:hypothetical protein
MGEPAAAITVTAWSILANEARADTFAALAAAIAAETYFRLELGN